MNNESPDINEIDINAYTEESDTKDLPSAGDEARPQINAEMDVTTEVPRYIGVGAGSVFGQNGRGRRPSNIL